MNHGETRERLVLKKSFSVLLLTLGIVLFGASVHQLLQRVLFPDLALWESPLVDILFDCGLAAVAVYYVLRRYRSVERALQESEKTAHAFLNAPTDILALLDVEGHVLALNETTAQRFGKTQHEMVGARIYDLLPPHLAASRRAHVEEVIRSGKPVRFRDERAGAHFDNSIYPVFERGKVERLVVFGRDVTAWVRAEAELESAHKLLQATIDGISDPLLLIGDDYQMQLMNQAARDDYTAGPLPLYCYQASHHRDTPCDGVAHPCPLTQVRQSLRPAKVVHEHVQQDGEKRIVEIIAAPLLGEDGRLTGIVETMRDVTGRVRAEQERDRLIAELEAKNVELEHFTHTVSHDLKSPLITIQGFLSLLLKNVEDGNAQRAQDNAAFISAAVERMRQLLEELLRLSRIGRVINPPEEVLMGELVREVVDALAVRLRERGVQVVISPDLLKPPVATVCVDRLRLRQVWENLLSNAIKYTGEQTEPLVELGLRQDGDGTVFYARDNGLGIDPGFQDKVFGLFEKLDPETEGVGAGLAIAKRIIEVHGGRVWVESEGKEQGSVFCFTLGE